MHNKLWCGKNSVKLLLQYLNIEFLHEHILICILHIRYIFKVTSLTVLTKPKQSYIMTVQKHKGEPDNVPNFNRGVKAIFTVREISR